MAQTIGNTTDAQEAAARMHVGAIDANFLSTFDYQQDPQFWDTIVNKYGSDLGLSFALRMMGAVDRTKIKGDKVSVFTSLNLERPVVVGVEIGTVLAGTHTFELQVDDDEYSSASGTCNVQVGSTFFIPGEYVTSTNADVVTYAQAYVKSVANTGTSEVFTCQLMDKDTAIATAIPVGTKLILGGTVHGTGTKQPKGVIGGTLVSDFVDNLIKSTTEIEGGVQAISSYLDKMQAKYVAAGQTRTGKGGYLYRAIMDQEFLMEAAKDKQITLGQRNTNEIKQVAGDNYFGNESVLRSGDGILPIMDAGASKYYYDTSFGMYDFDGISRLQEAQAVHTTDIAMLVGTEFSRTLENSGIEWVRANSGGTNFMSGYGDVGAMFSTYLKDGIRYHKHVLRSTANPFSYGVNDKLSTTAMLVPFGNVSKVKMGDVEYKMDNLEICHVNNNGENRTNVIGKVFGMNGLGETPLHQYDAGANYMFSQWLTILLNENQTVLVRKQ